MDRLASKVTQRFRTDGMIVRSTITIKEKNDSQLGYLGMNILKS